MRKFLTVLLSAIMIFSCTALSGCKDDGKKVDSKYGDYNVGVYYYPYWGVQDPDKEYNYVEDTEWDLTEQAIPRFDGHDQPKVPLWGFENASDPKVMGKKIKTANDYGVDAFMFDWYWYEENVTIVGKESELFLSGELELGFLQAENTNDLDFSIMWCNHDLGTQADGSVLYKGAVPEKNFVKMSNYIIENYFTKPNYWRVDGELYFCIYEIEKFVSGLGGIKTAQRVLYEFRQRVRDAGLGEIHINTMMWEIDKVDISQAILGGKLPENFSIPTYLGIDSTTSYVWNHDIPLHSALIDGINNGFSSDYVKYRQLYAEENQKMMNRYKDFNVPHYPNLSMGWDSSPRGSVNREWNLGLNGEGYPYSPILVNNTPYQFELAAIDLKKQIDDIKYHGEKVITVNSWNEWGEGSYIEPDMVNGYGFLNAIRKIFG